jgi:phosphohistidine phosphatase
MKKTIYLVRHAKAEDQALMFKDFDRELLSSGIMDAARMGKFLVDQGVKIGLLVSSTAVRAYQTSKVLAEQLSYEIDDIVEEQKLYDGGPKSYLSVINSCPEELEALMIVGHNPDITYFAEYLTHGNVMSMEKGGVMEIVVKDFKWEEISGKTGEMVCYISPKKLK